MGYLVGRELPETEWVVAAIWGRGEQAELGAYGKEERGPAPDAPSMLADT